MKEYDTIANMRSSDAKSFFRDSIDHGECIDNHDTSSERASRQLARIEQRRSQLVQVLGNLIDEQPSLSDRIIKRILPNRYNTKRERVERELASQMISLALDNLDVLIQDCAVREDELTSLSNKRAFREDFERHMSDPLRFPVALTMIDLDSFKGVNDQYGHEAGDQVLVAVARHLEDTCRLTDTVYRLGGDEFAVLTMITDEEDPDHPLSLEEVLESRYSFEISVPIVDNNLIPRELVVRSSSGTALGRERVDDTDKLLRAADSRLYVRKREKVDPEGISISSNTASVLMSFGGSVERVRGYINEHESEKDLDDLMVKLEAVVQVVSTWADNLEIDLHEIELQDEGSVITIPSDTFEELIDMIDGSDLSPLKRFMEKNPSSKLKSSVDILLLLEYALYSTISISEFAKELFESRNNTTN